MLTVLDLFSGIGGFSLGLERTGGFQTVAFCEIDPFCRKVLKKHWPEVPIFDDVRTLTHEQVGTVDVICGGFPCQDISVAGKGAGIEGERSGLWKEYARIIGEIRPRYVIVENVAALLGRGLGRVLGDLAEIGYDAEWHCIPASAVGAPHIRDRVWIIANAGHRLRAKIFSNCAAKQGDKSKEWDEKIKIGELDILVRRIFERSKNDWWDRQSGMDRSSDGVPDELDRRRSLGNAVVPQIPEIIGRSILKSMEAS